MFKDRQKVTSATPQVLSPRSNLPVGIYGFTGSDWVKLVVGSDGKISVRLEDPTGQFLKINTNGSIDVSLVGGTSGLAQAAKQDTQITQVTDLLGRMGTISAPSVGTLFERLADIQSKLATLATEADNGFEPSIIEVTGSLTSVGTAGAILTGPWYKKSLVQKITVIQESGSATSFMVEVLKVAAPVNERNTVARHVIFPNYMPRVDLLAQFPFVNGNGLEEVYVRVIPNAGTSNSYYVSVSGIKAK